jgi:hypothetical protein
LTAAARAQYSAGMAYIFTVDSRGGIQVLNPTGHRPVVFLYARNKEITLDRMIELMAQQGFHVTKKEPEGAGDASPPNEPL